MQAIFQRYKELQDIIAILGMDELSEEDKLTVHGALKDTIRGFKAIIAGEHDNLPEHAFYMVGGIEEAVETAKSAT